MRSWDRNGTGQIEMGEFISMWASSNEFAVNRLDGSTPRDFLIRTLVADVGEGMTNDTTALEIEGSGDPHHSDVTCSPLGVTRSAPARIEQTSRMASRRTNSCSDVAAYLCSKRPGPQDSSLSASEDTYVQIFIYLSTIVSA